MKNLSHDVIYEQTSEKELVKMWSDIKGNNMADILQAFIKQTYGSLEKAKEADKLADQNPNAQPEHDEDFVDTISPDLHKEIEDEFQNQLIAKHFKNPPIKESMIIPTKLKDEELNHKTEAHPLLKKYDHSLEEHRGHKLGLIKLTEDSEDIEAETGSVEEMFNNIFTDD